MTRSRPPSRPVKTMRHCPRRQPCSTRPSRPADQSQGSRLRTRQSNRSALVAQGIEHRFPKPCVAGSNPAGGTGPEPRSDSELPIRGARLELWVTRVEADARIATCGEIIIWPSA